MTIRGRHDWTVAGAGIACSADYFGLFDTGRDRTSVSVCVCVQIERAKTCAQNLTQDTIRHVMYTVIFKYFQSSRAQTNISDLGRRVLKVGIQFAARGQSKCNSLFDLCPH